MPNELTFEVIGRPVGKERQRQGKWGMYTPKRTKDYEKRVRDAYLEALGSPSEPSEQPIGMVIAMCFVPPKSVSKVTYRDMIEGKIYPTMRPDIDNIAKAVLDGLNGVAYKDDKQVVAIVLTKRYAEESKIIVTIGEV